MRSTIRRLATFLALTVPVLVVALGGATWGASRAGNATYRVPHSLSISSPAAERADEERSESAVILVVLDGVRWQDVYGSDRWRGHQRPTDPRSLMPNMYRLIDASAGDGWDGIAIGAPGHGPEMSASGPHFISMPGYLEIFSGRPDARCSRNDCVPSPARTIADQVRDACGPDDVAVITSWPNIARAASSDFEHRGPITNLTADQDQFALSAGRKLVVRADKLRSDPIMADLLDRGSRSSSFPGGGNYRPDALTGRIALRYLALRRPRFLFVGLGDSDEYAHKNRYGSYLDAIHQADAFLGEVVSTLHDMGARGRHTTILVTTDHGRARDFVDHGGRYPESGRVWLIAAGGDVHNHGLVESSRRYTLSDVAPTIRALLGISEGTGAPISEIAGRAN